MICIPLDWEEIFWRFFFSLEWLLQQFFFYEKKHCNSKTFIIILSQRNGVPHTTRVPQEIIHDHGIPDRKSCYWFYERAFICWSARKEIFISHNYFIDIQKQNAVSCYIHVYTDNSQWSKGVVNVIGLGICYVYVAFHPFDFKNGTLKGVSIGN